MFARGPVEVAYDIKGTVVYADEYKGDIVYHYPILIFNAVL